MSKRLASLFPHCQYAKKDVAKVEQGVEGLGQGQELLRGDGKALRVHGGGLFRREWALLKLEGSRVFSCLISVTFPWAIRPTQPC